MLQLLLLVVSVSSTAKLKQLEDSRTRSVLCYTMHAVLYCVVLCCTTIAVVVCVIL